MKRFIGFIGDSEGTATFDWIVLATGAVTLGLAILATTTSAGALGTDLPDTAQLLFSGRI